MKHIIFIILFATSLQAQTTTKTFVLSPDNVNYFEVIRVTQDDGTYTETAAIVGPLSAIAADAADKIETRTAALAQAAFAVSFTSRAISEINAQDASIFTLTTVSPLKAIQSKYRAELLAPGWTIDEGAGFVPLVFTVNAQGNLRVSINGAATKAATVFGAIIRIAAYPATGTTTDFYLSENGNRYFSLPNRAAQIKKP